MAIGEGANKFLNLCVPKLKTLRMVARRATYRRELALKRALQLGEGCAHSTISYHIQFMSKERSMAEKGFARIQAGESAAKVDKHRKTKFTLG